MCMKSCFIRLTSIVIVSIYDIMTLSCGVFMSLWCLPGRYYDMSSLCLLKQGRTVIRCKLIIIMASLGIVLPLKEDTGSSILGVGDSNPSDSGVGGVLGGVVGSP